MQIVTGIITVFLIVLGFIGTLVPFLPAEPLIFLGSIVYGLGFGFERIGKEIYTALILIAVLSYVVEHIGTSIGAKKFGASRAGMFGAVLGGGIGFIIGNIFGLFLGPFVGAFLCQLLVSWKIKRSLKAGFGAVIGFFSGMVARIFLSLTMIGLIIYGIVR